MNPLIDIIREDAEQICARVDLSPLAGKTFILTGATGIIGTYVLAVLDAFSRKSNITVYYSARHFPEVGSAQSHFAHNFFFRPADMGQHRMIEFPHADYCIFASGYGQPAKFVKHTKETLAINTNGLMSVANCIKPDGRMLYISSSEIYSGLTDGPFDETRIGTTTPQHPRGCYIEAKRCGEAIMQAYGQNFKSARVSLSYGPGTRKDDQRVINDFIRSAILYRNIIMRDAGHAYRVYCYVADTVELLFQILLRGKDTVYNVGGHSGTSILELATLISMATNVELLVPENKSVTGSPEVVSVSTTKAEQEFNKTSYVFLTDGLSKTIQWQKALYGKI